MVSIYLTIIEFTNVVLPKVTVHFVSELNFSAPLWLKCEPTLVKQMTADIVP